MLALKNKNILVTGVSRSKGIGASIAKTLASAGANVIVHGYSKYDFDQSYRDANAFYTDDLIDEMKSSGLSICKQVSAALSPMNIRVNCINPGATDTGYLFDEEHEEVAKMFPSGKWLTPDNAACLVHFLQSDYSKSITGQIIASEAGFNPLLIFEKNS